MSEGIELYIKIFEKISSYYHNQDDNEVCISEKISELFSDLKKTYDKELVKKSILFMLCIFENYYLDDFNTYKLDLENISNQEKDTLNGTLDNEFFDDLINSASIDLENIPDQEKQSIISILKEELTL